MFTNQFSLNTSSTSLMLEHVIFLSTKIPIILLEDLLIPTMVMLSILEHETNIMMKFQCLPFGNQRRSNRNCITKNECIHFVNQDAIYIAIVCFLPYWQECHPLNTYLQQWHYEELLDASSLQGFNKSLFI